MSLLGSGFQLGYLPPCSTYPHQPAYRSNRCTACHRDLYFLRACSLNTRDALSISERPINRGSTFSTRKA